MAVVRTIVLLFAWTAGGDEPVAAPDEDFYRRYFFDLGYGQAAYWAKQTDYRVILDGDVQRWAFVPDQDPDLSSRTTAIEWAIEAMQDDRDLDFDGYDLVLLVEAVPASLKTDGGATTVSSENRDHAGVAIRVGDSFDFAAHEIGHALGLSHSFGDPLFHAAGVAQGGEYGHPYCIMSAMAYGGLATPWAPIPPRENRREYLGLGPGLNAATALARGWLGAYDYPLAGAQPAEFVLRSRHYLGNQGSLAPQAIDVRAADGQNYVIEYRENDGWDKGQWNPKLIVNHAIGSTAEAKYPGRHSATFLKQLTVPITFGGAGGRYQGPGFGVQLLDRDLISHTVRLKIYPGTAPLSKFALTSAVATTDEREISSGETSFADGDLACVQGVWPYREVIRAQEATFDCTYDLAVPPIAVAWTLDGVALPGPDGTHSEFRDVVVADPKLQREKGLSVVRFDYRIEPLPTGSRLTVTSGPDNETVTIAVTATMTTAIGSANETARATFVGHEFVYPPDFYRRRWECLIKRVADRNLKYKVLFPPDGWQRIPDEFDPHPRELDVQPLLDGLAGFLERDDRRSFEQGLDELERVTGVDRSLVRIERLDDVFQLDRPEPQIEINLSTLEETPEG